MVYGPTRSLPIALTNLAYTNTLVSFYNNFKHVSFSLFLLKNIFTVEKVDFRFSVASYCLNSLPFYHTPSHNKPRQWPDSVQINLGSDFHTDSDVTV